MLIGKAAPSFSNTFVAGKPGTIVRGLFDSVRTLQAARLYAGTALLLSSLMLVHMGCDLSTGPGGRLEPSYCRLRPLPPPRNTVINVGTVKELEDALRVANDTGDVTIMLADGTYVIEYDTQIIRNDNITLRSDSGNRDAVIIRDNDLPRSPNPLIMVRGTGCTIADITIGGVRLTGLAFTSDADDALVHNVRFANVYSYMIVIRQLSGTTARMERGVIEWCLFEYPAGEAGDIYTGGIAGRYADGWIVHHNTFRGINGPGAEVAGFAIQFSDESSNTIVEHNTIYNCDRGICFGFGLGSISHTGGIIRNNMIHTRRGVGISLKSASSASIYNNTVLVDEYSAAIEYCFAGTQLASIINNLANAPVAARDGATGVVETNVDSARVSWFIDAAGGDLRLAYAIAAVVDQGQSLPEVEIDFDCEARPKGDACDIGADEW